MPDEMHRRVWIRPVMIVFSTLLQLSAAGCLHLEQTPQMNQKHGVSVAALVERLVNVDDGYQEVTVNNSHVVVRTSAMEDLARLHGEGLLPVIVEAMEDSQLSFDAFVRCYSLADQILRTRNPEITLYWQGGVTVVDTRSGIARFSPRGQMDLEAFRRDVTSSVRSQFQRNTAVRVDAATTGRATGLSEDD